MYIELKTPRLLLRPLGLQDIRTTHLYASDVENTKYMLFLPNHSLEETRIFLSHVEEEWKKDVPSVYEFAIVYQQEHIGAISLGIVDFKMAEIGWILRKGYWNKGYITEAAEAIKQFAKSHLHLTTLIAHCDSQNMASQRVMEKINMVRLNQTSFRKNKLFSLPSIEWTYQLSL